LILDSRVCGLDSLLRKDKNFISRVDKIITSLNYAWK
jgi:hypothetical protein